MKLLFTTSITVVMTFVITFILVHDHLTGRFPWEKDETGDVIRVSLQSEILQETREVIIKLPLSYSPQKEYPVLYVLDGGLSQVLDAASTLEILSCNGYAPETIVVGIPNPTMEARQRDLTPPNMVTDIDDAASDPGSGDKFLEFLQKELITWVDSQYSTTSYRLISGHSRGGLLVLYSLIIKQDLFQARFCYSTPFWRQDEIILRSLDEYIAKTDSLNTFLFFSAGDIETENIKRGTKSLAERLQRNTPSGMYWSYQVTSKADHQSNARQSVWRGLGSWGKHVLKQ